MEKIIPNKIRQNENSFNICHKNTTSNTFKYRKHLSFDYILFILVGFKFFIVARLSKTPIRRSLQFKQKLCWHRKCNWLRVLCDSIFFLYPTILFEWLCWIKKLNRITLVKYKHTSMISTVFVWHSNHWILLQMSYYLYIVFIRMNWFFFKNSSQVWAICCMHISLVSYMIFM